MTQLRRQRLIDLRARGQVSDLPKGHIDRARYFFHLVIVDLLRLVTGAMIVLVHAVEKEDDRNAFARVVVVIAAEEKAIRVLRIVLTDIVL